MTTSDRFREVQELFLAAVKLPAAEREAFLNSRYPHDQSIRDEVRSLLAEDRRESGFLPPAPEQSRAFGLPEGTLLGHYKISEPIGKGGMGEVYRAIDLKLQRDVAVKVLPEHLAKDPERIARFRREAQLLAALNHPHIGGIYGLEESDHVLALVMEQQHSTRRHGILSGHP